MPPTPTQLLHLLINIGLGTYCAATLGVEASVAAALHDQFWVYQRHGVQEQMVWYTYNQAIA
ncbi:hypothetical protein [Trichothermofontia sp.]